MSLGLKYKNENKIFEEKVVGGVPYLSFPLLENTGIVSQGFSTRLGGVSKGHCATMNISSMRGDDPVAVKENTRLIANAIGFDKTKMVYTHQTHTTNVVRVQADDFGKHFPETDGMVTNEKGAVLVTFYADCVPLYFVDPVKKAIGLSHSGWRGTVNRMGKVTIEKMIAEFRSNPSDIVAAIGPSICQDCFEVGEEVVEAFKKGFDKKYWHELFYKKDKVVESAKPENEAENSITEKFYIDLWRANEIVLEEAGVKKENIAVSNLCTHCNPDLLFSHRTTGFDRGNLSAFLSLR